MFDDSKAKFNALFHIIFLLVVMVAGPLFLRAGDAGIPYSHELKKDKFADALDISGRDIGFKKDTASWRLESGKAWIAEPVSVDGRARVVGMYFKGDGRFTMTIPDWVEQEQFKRMSRSKKGDGIDAAFSRMIVRTGGPLLDKLLGKPAGKYRSKRVFKSRRKVWRLVGKTDIDARLAEALCNRDEDYLLVEMKTKRWGWLTFVFDKTLPEEIKLIRYRRTNNFPETWVSLDRASDRLPDGRPRSEPRPPVDVTDIAVKADFTKSHWNMERIYQNVFWSLTVGFKAVIRFTPTPEGSGNRILRLVLDGKARVKSVTTRDGKPLRFTRKRLRKAILSKGSERYDRYLRVETDTPPETGKEQQIVVVYDMDLKNFAAGHQWYPQVSEGMTDRYSFTFEARHTKKQEVVAMGIKKDSITKGKIKISSWVTETPVRFYGFTLGKDFKKENVKLPGMPDVVAFAPSRPFTTGNQVRNVGIDVARSIEFFSRYFDVSFPSPVYYATVADGWFQESYGSVFHIPKRIFFEYRYRYWEFWRAREVAREVFGNMIGWKSYRDKWLSDGFARYAALLFVRSTLPKKRDYGELLYLDSDSVRLRVHPMTRKRIGPIAVGRRASVAEWTDAHEVQVEKKGALVLHMIRENLETKTGGDTVFRNILRDFVATYKGKLASTEDFKGILEKHTGKDWDWFFRQWVYGTTLPSYSWDYRVGKRNREGFHKTTITIKQKKVPADFRMEIPVRVMFYDGTHERLLVTVDKKETVFTRDFEKKPKKIKVMPNFSVINL